MPRLNSCCAAALQEIGKTTSPSRSGFPALGFGASASALAVAAHAKINNNDPARLFHMSITSKIRELA
jgi:hypothetical protein